LNEREGERREGKTGKIEIRSEEEGGRTKTKERGGFITSKR